MDTVIIILGVILLVPVVIVVGGVFAYILSYQATMGKHQALKSLTKKLSNEKEETK